MNQKRSVNLIRLADQLSKSNVLQVGSFTLKSGFTAPFYLDMRKIQSHPNTLHTVTDIFCDMLSKDNKKSLIAGIPEAATVLAVAVGYKLKQPIIQPRKSIKQHGEKKLIEGEYKRGDKVVLIDDLITRGDSKLETISQIESAGLTLDKLIVLIDWQKGGIENITKKGYKIEAAYTATELMDALLSLNKITKVRHKAIIDYINS